MSKNFQPLEDRILILPIKKTEPEKTASGIIKIENHADTKEGVVVSVGVGYTARDTGVFVQTVLHEGDIVLYGANAGLPIEVPNENGGKDECILLREGDILLLIGRKED